MVFSLVFFRVHIPNSVHFDIFKCVTSTPEILFNHPDTNCFTDCIQSLGVWPDTHVVAYDRLGPISAYRAWRMLRVRLPSEHCVAY
ncbi:hypothetical protein DPMN_158665 [Dreissena polymorpha]|uniref:Rhodanese domain-containing protein n=1 Tax=Dreissena polymorpha TaxID=45954 RepID=A0A9D4IR25_DREPO|nr:hypothetical protein DPMN_158665 [Dreissena polymorpha]